MKFCFEHDFAANGATRQGNSLFRNIAECTHCHLVILPWEYDALKKIMEGPVVVEEIPEDPEA